MRRDRGQRHGPSELTWTELLWLTAPPKAGSPAAKQRDVDESIASPDWNWSSTAMPTPLRIALAFIASLWAVGLIALAVGAPGEIILATAVIGTAGAAVEWMAHR